MQLAWGGHERVACISSASLFNGIKKRSHKLTFANGPLWYPSHVAGERLCLCLVDLDELLHDILYAVAVICPLVSDWAITPVLAYRRKRPEDTATNAERLQQPPIKNISQ